MIITAASGMNMEDEDMINKITKRLLAFLLSLTMMVTLTPAVAFAETDADADVGAETVQEEAFYGEATVDGVGIRVTADPGVFPAGALLKARKATDEEIAAAMEAVEAAAETEEEVNSYFFDISIVDEDGNEIQPDTSKGTVEVAFFASEVEDEDYDIEVFNVHGGELNALDVVTSDGAATVEPEGFCTFVFRCVPKICPTPTPTPCPTPTPTPTCYTVTASIEGWTYGDQPNEPSYTTTAPGVKSVTYKYFDANMVEIEAPTSTTPAGKYYVKAIVEYKCGTICSCPVPFTIKKKAITAVVGDQTITYGDPAPTEAPDVTFEGLVDPDTPEVLDADFTFTYVDYEAGSPAGDYEIAADGTVTAQNYELDKIVNGTLHVLKKGVTLTVKDQACKYGDPAPVEEAGIAKYDGLLDKDMEDGQPKEGVLEADLTYTYVDYEAGSPVGEYAIKAEGTITSQNYELVEIIPGVLTVGKSVLVITAKDNTIVYGDDPAGNGFTAEGFVDGDDESVLDVSGLGYNFTYEKFGDIGTYDIVPYGIKAQDYAITYVKGNLTVTPREVKIIWSDTNFTYNGKDQVPTAEISKDSLARPEDVVKVTEVTGAKKDVGKDYVAEAVTIDNPNYILPEDKTTKFQINPVALTITAKDNTIYYGEKPAAKGVTYQGFVAGESEKNLKGALTYTFTYAQYQKPGNYKITPAGYSSGNYIITYKQGNLKVLDYNSTLVAKVEAKGKTAGKLTWIKHSGAERYVVTMAKCNLKETKFHLKKIKTVNAKTLTFTKKGLKKNSLYKFRVLAQKKINGKYKTIAKSKIMHFVTGNQNKKWTNQKALKVNKTKLNLKVGQKFQIKATYKLEVKGKKPIRDDHAKDLRYLSTNKKVASVNKKGVVTAKGPGYCKIYTQTVNGKWKAITVTTVTK
jgi:hypothetical protein